MGNKLTLTGGTDWIAGDDLDAVDLVETMERTGRLGIPVGGITLWHKNFGEKETGQATSVVAGELVDAAATFITNSVTTSDFVHLIDLIDTTSVGPVNNGTFTVVTRTLASVGVTVDRCTVNLEGSGGGGGAQIGRVIYTYLDTSTSTVSKSAVGAFGPSVFTLSNPTPGKKVTSIKFEIQTFNATDNITGKDLSIFFLETSGITSIDSETELTIAEDIVNSTDITYKVGKTPVLNGWFQECVGTVAERTVTDSESPYDGEVLPDLADEHIRLLGNSGTAGTLSDSNANESTFSFVPVMRIK